MQGMYERCAGLDVHTKTVVACVRTLEGPEARPLGTRPAALLALAEWLLACGCTHVAIESPGDDWKPVFTIPGGTCEVIVVQAQPVKAVPGRKTAGKEAAWPAALLPHGLWRASVMPPGAPRELRDVPRYRSPFIQERVPLIKRVQKLLGEANSTLAAVASALLGAAGRAILAARLAGPSDPQALADLAQGRRRRTRAPVANALAGRITPPHRVVLTALWCQLDSLDDTMARFEAQIRALYGPFEAAASLLETSPGGARRTAAMLVAELGTAMSRFPRADHLASGAGVAPGHHASAGQRAAGETRKGHRVLRTSLGQAAPAAARPRGPSLSAQYRRLATRRGKKRAILAVAHSMLVMAYSMSQRQEPYRDAGADVFDRRQPEDTARRLVQRLESLGYHVTPQSSSTDVMP